MSSLRVSNEYYNDLVLKLERLMAYRELLKDPIIQLVKKLIEKLSSRDVELTEINRLYHEYAYNLLTASEKLGMKGNLHKEYIMNLIMTNKNFFSLACEAHGLKIHKSLYSIALNDMEILKSLLEMDFTPITDNIGVSNFLEEYYSMGTILSENRFEDAQVKLLQEDSVQGFTDKIIQYYDSIGCGELANSIAFRWSHETGLLGVQNYDSIQLEDIVGYTYQKEVLMKNTEAFIKGYPANNVLLVGARGTGKSSSIKALLNKYYRDGLRLLEITKSQILYLSEILNELKNRGKYFILFIDDLSFEEGEIEYKQMKSILDGGIEKSPGNVLIYATSNRRHLIKETWSEREEEIHKTDTLNEKLSLSDRFGITLTYVSPNQNEYLAMVESIAEKYNIDIPKDVLKQEAIKWEMHQNGRSGRTAKQFVNYLLNDNHI